MEHLSRGALRGPRSPARSALFCQRTDCASQRYGPVACVNCSSGELSLCTSRKCCRNLGTNIGGDFIGPDRDLVCQAYHSTHADHQRFSGMVLTAPVNFAGKGHATAFDLDSNRASGESSAT